MPREPNTSNGIGFYNSFKNQKACFRIPIKVLFKRIYSHFKSYTRNILKDSGHCNSNAPFYLINNGRNSGPDTTYTILFYIIKS